MFNVIKGSWALLLGMFMLMIGNGLQANILALRGAEEGFSQSIMGFVMSAYFAGFFIGSRVTTELIRRVGHVRVFAAFASFISAAFIIFPLFPNPYVWIACRVIIGLSFAGVYIVSESWLNNSAENGQRAQVLSIYSMVQMIGLIVSGWMILLAPAGGFELFVIMSILVSFSFAPILLSGEKAPVFESTGALSMREMAKASPLGVVVVFAVGGLFALQFTMIGQFTVAKGLSSGELAMIFTAIYVGGMILQMPIGQLSDKIDRRIVIIGICIFGAASLGIGLIFSSHFYVLLAMSFILGGLTNPLYSVAVAYVNDRVEWDKMAAASAGMMFINGLGAIGMPIIAGFLMATLGADVFWMMLIAIFLMLATFGLYRMTVREAVAEDVSAIYATMTPGSSPVMMEVTQEMVSDELDAQLEGLDEDFARFTPQEVIECWRDEVGASNWYAQSDDIDQLIRERFATLHRRLNDGVYEDWVDTAQGALAIIIVLDQFSRNLYRDDARAFESDYRAREIAQSAIDAGFDKEFDVDMRQFFYMPFCHSEIWADQEFAVEAGEKAGLTNNMLDFKIHREIIARFGRFPYRNDVLGRETTEEEQAFLDSGGYGMIRQELSK